jgi:hypothetical protein
VLVEGGKIMVEFPAVIVLAGQLVTVAVTITVVRGWLTLAVGPMVTLDGQLVIIPGLVGIDGAHIPTK